METGKTGKYFKYAIGEIILVVIGILIALSINNWNEQRKMDTATQLILKQIQLDILSNIETAENAKKAYNYKDSIFWLMKQKELTPTDFTGIKGQRYRRTIGTFNNLSMTERGFHNLKAHPGIQPGDYAEIIKDLEDLGENSFMFNRIDQQIKDAHENHFEYRRTNFDWFSNKFWKGEISEEELKFYAYNPQLKNYILRKSNLGHQALYASEYYIFDSKQIYKKIAEALGQKNQELPKSIDNEISLTLSEKQAFTGTYQLHYAPPLNTADRHSSVDSLIISMDDKSKLKYKKFVNEEIYEFDLNPIEKNLLESIDNYLRVHLSIDENGFLKLKDFIGIPYLFKKVSHD